MGNGKWETNGVKVNHPTPRLGYDAFESRTTLAVLENTVAQRKQKTGAYRLMNVELPRPTYISSWDKCQMNFSDLVGKPLGHSPSRHFITAIASHSMSGCITLASLGLKFL